MGLSATGSVTTISDVYSSYNTDTTEKADSSSKADGASKEKEEGTEGVVYEKSSSTEGTSSATYSITKMSAEDRAALVQQLKADQESRQNQLVSIVQQMLTGQATTYAKATGDDIWSFLAKGDFSNVDEAAKAQAQEDISEDGYYGVKQTSQRLFDFACALAGDDVDSLKEMQEAMQKGYEEATGAWGKDLPDICKQTIDAANQLFEDYYSSVSGETDSE
jgi:hypothetical protein